MNKTEAWQIAEKITNQELLEMFMNAKNNMTTDDWKERSAVNPGFTKGAIWKILGEKFDVNMSYHVMGKKNMVWEFGEFLPGRFRLPKKTKRKLPPMHHQEPNFDNYD